MYRVVFLNTAYFFSEHRLCTKKLPDWRGISRKLKQRYERLVRLRDTGFHVAASAQGVGGQCLFPKYWAMLTVWPTIEAHPLEACEMRKRMRFLKPSIGRFRILYDIERYRCGFTHNQKYSGIFPQKKKTIYYERWRRCVHAHTFQPPLEHRMQLWKNSERNL